MLEHTWVSDFKTAEDTMNSLFAIWLLLRIHLIVKVMCLLLQSVTFCAYTTFGPVATSSPAHSTA